MSIYQKLVEKNLIREEKFRQKPVRVTQKTRGWMWKAEYEVITINGKKYNFSMWHHFSNDDGTIIWKPTINEIKHLMFCKDVFCGDNYFDATWHTISVKGSLNLSKRGFFNDFNKMYKKEVKKQIKNGEWKTNPDIELLL